MENLKSTDEKIMRRMANAIRVLAAEAVQEANSGHPGMPMGMADVATVLFSKFINIDPSTPDWPDRDRFVLSAGHGSMLIYALNYLLGYDDMPIESIKNFRQLNFNTPGHPEYGHTKGVETTTGPLGQGFATSVGMALAEKLLNARFKNELVDHFTYTIVGDGCLQEGISHEAIEFAGHLKLSKLIVLWDDNKISIDGETNLSTSSNQLARFKASGWDAQIIDGHNFEEITNAIDKAKKSTKPSLIACKTIIGYGSPNLAGTEKTHGAPLGKDEVEEVKRHLNWNYEPFEVPNELIEEWKKVGLRGNTKRKDWLLKLESSSKKQKFANFHNTDINKKFEKKFRSYLKKLKTDKPKIATRQASLNFLEVINSSIENTIGGSADLTGSNLTKTKNMKPIMPRKFKGNYIHYGIREHMMGAVMNGIALHKGFLPYGGTFLVFSDYMRASMRLSSIMKAKVVYVLTHDSIGLGEDGPTHQPIEHLAMLRATPNLNVFRPADAVETAEAWCLALSHNGPSVLALSRQGLPAIRDEKNFENLTEKGGYIIKDVKGNRDVSILASGSEVNIALQVSDLLSKHKVNAAVISMPCWELFENQNNDYKSNVIGNVLKVAIEAGSELGWHKYIGSKGMFFGLNTFGASAPALDLFKHFGLDPEEIKEKILKRLN